MITPLFIKTIQLCNYIYNLSGFSSTPQTRDAKTKHLYPVGATRLHQSTTGVHSIGSGRREASPAPEVG
ncbi:hypothetical protein [Coleofasciculus sp. F4-SAH-05]|uniref:hypothetical protein n=1 Tax=Coleofasciculus sp. F4-SAH-05 TaxID=3069525 RepID=UPI0032F4561F